MPMVAADCTPHWELFSSAPYAQIAFPDTYVTYYRYRFALPAGELTLTGDFPYARYMSFITYDATTANPAADLPDYKIVPDPGASNPFVPGHDRSETPRSYTVHVVPAGSPDAGNPNTIVLPATPGATFAELWYRVYVPDQGRDAIGGVPLPTITAAGGDCPAVSDQPDPSILGALGNLPPHGDDGTLGFYKPAAQGLYANGDNLYLATRFNLFPQDVAIVTFEAPSFPDTGAGLPSFSGAEDVRYYSLCLGGADQRTSSCLDDADLHVPAGQTIKVVVGPESVRQTAVSRGYAFLPWGKQFLQFLIYRNLLARPDFAGNLVNVPGWQVGGDPAAGLATGHIGTYAPRGVECTVQAFESSGCE